MEKLIDLDNKRDMSTIRKKIDIDKSIRSRIKSLSKHHSEIRTRSRENGSVQSTYESQDMGKSHSIESLQKYD